MRSFELGQHVDSSMNPSCLSVKQGENSNNDDEIKSRYFRFQTDTSVPATRYIVHFDVFPNDGHPNDKGESTGRKRMLVVKTYVEEKA